MVAIALAKPPLPSNDHYDRLSLGSFHRSIMFHRTSAIKFVYTKVYFMYTDGRNECIRDIKPCGICPGTSNPGNCIGGRCICDLE